MNNKLKNVGIIGTGKYVPDNLVTNMALSNIVDTNDEWIYTRSGIKERRISAGENTSDLATKAALDAMKAAGIDATEIDIIIVATCTPDKFIPSTACLLQSNIGAINATAFDISAACSGFVYGIDIATQYIQTGKARTVLMIGAEVFSKIIDWDKRESCVLFGDGAGAVVLRECKEIGIITTYTKSDGRSSAALNCNALEVKNPWTKNNELEFNNYFSMNGMEVFKLALRAVIDSIKKVLESSGCSIDEIKYIVTHQANSRIIDACAKKLKVDKKKFYMNIEHYGNTSAASIPIAFDEIIKKRLIKKGEKVLLIGFGGGFTWGATLITY